MNHDEKKTTPMMQQWHECKANAKDALLLFRMGDFYECFYEDAALVAKELELTLTKRQEIPMSGVPWHAAEGYIDRLLARGYKVAIAEQMEDPKVAKGIVKRAIARILTPGTLVSSSLLSEKTHHYIAAINQVGTLFGLAICDVTTGKFFLSEHESAQDLFQEAHRLQPKEVVVARKFKDHFSNELKPYFLSEASDWSFDHKMAYAYLTRHFKVQHLDGFGLKGKVALINAAGALLNYLKEELSHPIDHIAKPQCRSNHSVLGIDSNAERHLELQTLLQLIDRTLTPMGGRKIREWLKKPLLDVKAIRLRQEAVQALGSASLLQSLRSPLKGIRDLERLMMKIGTRLANPKDFISLKSSLQQIALLKETIAPQTTTLFSEIKSSLVDVSGLIDLLEKALVEEPPLRLSEGEVFREGYDPQLDEWKALMRNSKEWLASYQAEIQSESGAKSARIVYSKIFGYCIEVSRGQAKLLEERFEKRQTLATCERFTSQRLKEYESKVLSAEERKLAREKELFEALIIKVWEEREKVMTIAAAVAHLDALFALGEVAFLNRYVCPHVDESDVLEIVDGRHPVIESILSRECFIPNDTRFEGSLTLITGPNMAGKSTYIRQVALIVILAQMGSFVPAKRATIGVVDKIFTRIGAQDDLTRGQSTFMVEMSETANILNHVTAKSLVILDEIGRGTSTYDGLSIAWAVAEFLLVKQAKTLFATHYFELTTLEQTHSQAKNYHAAVKELKDDIIFLHKIVVGKADRSYGIHVARLAGLPLPLIGRATEILGQLEKQSTRKDSIQKILEKKTKEQQLQLF